MNRLGMLSSSSKNNKDSSAKTNMIHFFNLKTINENDWIMNNVIRNHNGTFNVR